MIARGHFWIAIVLLTLDRLRRPLRRTGRQGLQARQPVAARSATRRPYRAADSLILGCVAFYLTAHGHGQLVLLPFAILTTTYLISYQRSKAESLGLAAKGGLMERAERMILLGIGLLAKPIFIPVLWIMLALTAMTAAGRFYRIWQIAASSADPPMTQAGRIDHHRAGFAEDVVPCAANRGRSNEGHTVQDARRRHGGATARTLRRGDREGHREGRGAAQCPRARDNLRRQRGARVGRGRRGLDGANREPIPLSGASRATGSTGPKARSCPASTGHGVRGFRFCEGQEHLDEAKEQGRGTIIALPHDG